MLWHSMGEVVGLHLPHGKQLVAQALADDTFMFLRAEKANIDRAMEAWNKFALASGLKIISASKISPHCMHGI